MAEKDRDPTQKRLRDARKRGEVVFSTDVASGVVFIVVVVSMWLLGPALFSMLRELWLHATSARLLTQPDDRFPELLQHSAQVLVMAVVAVSALAGLAGLAGSFFQVGGIAAWERIKPDVNRMNPAEGFKRIFTTRNLINLLKMVVKTLLLAGLMWVVIRTCVDTALKLGFAGPSATMTVSARMVLTMFAWAGLVYLLMAVVDYAHMRYEYIKGLKMSVEDIRREHKEVEGSPLNASRRRSAHFEAVYFTLADRVRAASAVIHSPRVAVALQYLGEKDLPRVIAKGEGDMATQIRGIAAEASVPTEFDPSLAELIYADVPLDRPVPRPLYRDVAKLLRWAQDTPSA